MAAYKKTTQIWATSNSILRLLVDMSSSSFKLPFLFSSLSRFDLLMHLNWCYYVVLNVNLTKHLQQSSFLMKYHRARKKVYKDMKGKM